MSAGTLSLRDLEYALAVARLRHFGKAADSCHVSQPTLSEQIRKLEEQLGIALFERNTRRVAASARGEAMLQQAEQVLMEAQRLLDMAKHLSVPMSGILRLGAIATLGPYYFPHLLRTTHATYPSLTLRLTEGKTAELLQALRRGELDCILAALPIAASGLAQQSLFFEPFFLVAPIHHPLAKAPAPSLARIRTKELLLLEEGHCLREQALQLCRGNPAAIQRHATGLETLWHMIAAGEGYSLLPALSVTKHETLDMVAVRPLQDSGSGRKIALLWRNSDPRSREFSQYARFLQAQAPACVQAPVEANPRPRAAKKTMRPRNTSAQLVRRKRS